MGDVSPKAITAVLTTRGAAGALDGAQKLDVPNASVWFVELTGNFVDKDAFLPSGAAFPEGTEVDFTIDTQTQSILDFGISDNAPDLYSLGTVYSITTN